jgi:hypothetical protein
MLVSERPSANNKGQSIKYLCLQKENTEVPSKSITTFAAILLVALTLFAACRETEPLNLEMRRIADQLDRTKSKDLVSVTLNEDERSGFPLVWQRTRIDSKSWEDFRKVLGKYLREFDKNQLGSVTASHELIIVMDDSEIRLDLYEVKTARSQKTTLIRDLTEAIGAQ